MTKGSNRKGSDASKRIKALQEKGTKVKDRGGRNLGVKDEHSRVAKGNLTQQGSQKRR